MLNNEKKRSSVFWLNFFFKSGNVLLSQAAARQVPSTLEDFTSVFGMGTGVAPPPSSLDMGFIKPWKLHIEHSNVKTIRSSPRSISTCQLNTLLHLHLRPITTLSSWDLTPFLDGKSHLEGGFALRCLQRLSRPNLATQLCHWHDNWSTSGSSIPVLSY